MEQQRAMAEAVSLLSHTACAAASNSAEHLQSPDPNFLAMVEEATRPNCADDNIVAGSDLKIVMCLTTFCRTEQLKSALPINLACAWGLRDKIVWVLADLNDEGESSVLLPWLAETVAAPIASGQLHIVRRAEVWSGWHACFAKNTSHMAGLYIAERYVGPEDAQDVILVNCDSDNLPSTGFFPVPPRAALEIIHARSRGLGGLAVA